jgi:hypothetical protein
MNTTTDPKANEPDDVWVARADERLVHAYDQIARADEQLARLNEQLSKLEQAASDPSTVVGHRPPRSRSALRGVIGLLLAVFIFVGAFVSLSSYGDEAKLMVAQWAPQLISTSSLPIEKPGLPAQPSPSTVQVAAATPGLPQPTASAQTAPQEVAPTAAPISPELTQLLQTMARDLANVQQGIEQLKTSQKELARENGRTAEQLKASQEQMARAIANASEENLRPRTSAAPPQANASEAGGLLARAKALVVQGNILAARGVLEPAAETGSAQAIFALAETYDPNVLATWRTRGTRGDATRARDLYARAYEGGIKAAKDRSDSLVIGNGERKPASWFGREEANY